jgi:molybdopterin/thiamine biosynthesis adenylyltransferase
LKTEIDEKIRTLSTPGTLPDGTAYRRISVERVSTLAKASGVSGRHIEVAALEQDIVPERYARNMKTYSIEDQIVLLNARAAVVGLGGLGGAVIEILARVGIGTLILIDGDAFEDSNLNRQFLGTEDLLGTPKSDAAAKKVEQINSSVGVDPHHEFLSDENADRLIHRAHVVVDCLDNIETRFALERASKKTGVPLVSAAVAGVSGHVTTIFPEDQGLELNYGKPEGLPQKGAETSLGCLSQSVTVLAALECSEVVKVLLKKGTVLRNRLLYVDLTDNSFEVMQLQ